MGRVKTPDELTEAFRARGLKVTPQRQCIFRILHHHRGHPTAESVYAEASAEMPTISLRTVYQTLNDLAAMGELAQLELGTGSSRFDPTLEPHHHLVCVDCGDVRPFEDPQLERVLEGTATRSDYTVEGHDVVLKGRCPDCRAE